MPSRKRLEMTSSRRTDGSTTELLELLLTPSTWPRWQTEIRRIEGPPEIDHGDAVHGEAKLLGFRVEGRSDATRIDGGIVEEDVIVGVRMKIRYEVSADDNGAIVTRRLVADLPGGIAGRVLSFFLARRLKKMHEDVLDRLVSLASGSRAVVGDEIGHRVHQIPQRHDADGVVHLHNE